MKHPKKIMEHPKKVIRIIKTEYCDSCLYIEHKGTSFEFCSHYGEYLESKCPSYK